MTDAQTHPFRLDGQVAVVTGSSKGIGRSIAETMAALGASVVISSRKKEPCEAVAAAIRDAGGEAVAIPCNVSRKPEVQGLIARTLEQFGRIDTMVANAAVNPHYGPLTTLEDSHFDKIMEANVKANVWFANLVLPGMAERGGGTMILISSIGGLYGSGEIGAYCVSKAADMSLARNLAVEWGPRNVRVNCIAPGLIKTDMARALWEDRVHFEKRMERTPLRRIGRPDEIGPVAAFLASPAASYITGQTIVADGGVTIA